MEIFINGRFLTQPITGVQRFAHEIVKALDLYIAKMGLSNELNITILTPKTQLKPIEFKHIKVMTVGRLTGHAWEQFELSIFTKGNLLLNLCNAGPIFKGNQITVIHDASVFSNGANYSFAFRNWYRLLIHIQSRFSKRIVTVSKFSKSELTKYLKIDSEQIDVIYEGKEHFTTIKPNSKILEKHQLPSKSFILAVSSLNPNKNFNAIIESIQHLENRKRLSIVIAGGIDQKIFKLEKLKLKNEVLHLGYVSDEELKALYEHAYCFIYPSFYEGFGLPPLEAMSVGCPVIISHSASLPEVGGDAVLYCDPYNAKSIAEQVELLMKDEGLRTRLIRQGFEQSERFSWNLAASELISVIKHVSKIA